MIVLQLSPWPRVKSRIEAINPSAPSRLIFSALARDNRLSGEFKR